MDAHEAGLVFPVFGFTRYLGQYFGAESLEVLTQPRGTLLRPDGLLGCEIVDSAGARFRITGITPPAGLKPPYSRAFIRVALDLQPIGRTTFEALKARIASQTRRLSNYGCEVQGRLNDLAYIRTADHLGQLVSWAGGEFKGRSWKGYEPYMGQAPDPPFDDAPIGPSVTLEEVELAWPVLGIPVPPRSLVRLGLFSGPSDVTHAAVAMLRPGVYPRMELIDSQWRRFRIVKADAIRRTALSGLSILAAKLLNTRLDIACWLEPLPPTSKEAVRKPLLAMYEDDPAGWTWSFERKDQKREWARLIQGADLAAMAGGVVGP